MINIATEYSFDVVSRVNMAEVTNAVHQSTREVQTRFDFRGSKATIDLDAKNSVITLTAEDDQRLRNLLELLQQKLAKRGVSLRSLEVDQAAPAGGSMLRQVVHLRQGIPAEKAKEMQRVVRDQKLKVTAQIQDDQLRVFGPKKDELQTVIALLKDRDFGLDLQFENYR